MLFVADDAVAVGMRHDLSGVSTSGLANPYIDYAQDFDSVVNITWATYRGNYQASGTLVHSTTVGEYKILTAAHVVDGSSGAPRPDGLVDASQFIVKFGDNPETISHRVIVPRRNVVTHPRWAAGDPVATGLDRGAAQFDLAVLTFSENDLTLGNANSLPDGYGAWGGNSLGEVATLVGYGRSGLGDDFANAKDGHRRAGKNVIDAVDALSAEANDGFTLRADFDAITFSENRSVLGFDGAAQYLEASTARGDSGGPLLLSQYNNLVVGVLHGGYNHFPGAETSEYGDVGVWAPLGDPLNRQFLELNGVAYNDFGILSSQAVVASVPEPSHRFLSIVGMLLLLTRRNRFRQMARKD